MKVAENRVQWRAVEVANFVLRSSKRSSSTVVETMQA
jgi:hypothetical protein